MTKVRLGLLLLVAVSIGLFLTTSVRAEPPGGEGEEGEKTSIAPFAAHPVVRIHGSTATTRSRITNRTSWSMPPTRST